jgi:hypothetical protein
MYDVVTNYIDSVSDPRDGGVNYSS